jgi:hypothetical protein
VAAGSAELRLDYEQTLATYRQLAEIRFKLLAFVPALSGVAVALLAREDLALDRWATVAVAMLGFLVTLGIVLYDQRNTQFYNGAITRAQELERCLGFPKFGGDLNPGLFGSRKDHRTRRLLGLPIGHDLGLALVYSPVLAAWVFVAVHAIGSATWVAAIAGAGIALLFFIQFRWNDRKFPHLRRRWQDWQDWRIARSNARRFLQAVADGDAKRVGALSTHAEGTRLTRGRRGARPTKVSEAIDLLRGQGRRVRTRDFDDSSIEITKPASLEIKEYAATDQDGTTALVKERGSNEALTLRRVGGEWLVDLGA